MIKLYSSQTDNSSDCLEEIFAGFVKKKKIKSPILIGNLGNFIKLFII